MWCSVLSDSLRPHGLQPARLLYPGNSLSKNTGELVGSPCPLPRDLPNPGIEPRSPTLQVDALQSEPPGKPIIYSMLCYAKSLQSCPTLCDPIDGSPPGSPVRGILQARILEWVDISFSQRKVKVKSLSRVRLLVTPWTAAYQAPPSMGFSRPRVLEWGATVFSNHLF